MLMKDRTVLPATYTYITDISTV